MKDQKSLLNKCLQNDIPAMVISGNDKLAVPVLVKYMDEAQKAGCSNEFIRDFADVIHEFKVYQTEEPRAVKLPD